MDCLFRSAGHTSQLSHAFWRRRTCFQHVKNLVSVASNTQKIEGTKMYQIPTPAIELPRILTVSTQSTCQFQTTSCWQQLPGSKHIFIEHSSETRSVAPWPTSYGAPWTISWNISIDTIEMTVMSVSFLNITTLARACTVIKLLPDCNDWKWPLKGKQTTRSTIVRIIRYSLVTVYVNPIAPCSSLCFRRQDA